jgi:hypothetical protein
MGKNEKYERVRSDLWVNKELKKAINISHDSSNRYFVSQWELNRNGNAKKMLGKSRETKDYKSSEKLIKAILKNRV